MEPSTINNQIKLQNTADIDSETFNECRGDNVIETIRNLYYDHDCSALTLSQAAPIAVKEAGIGYTLGKFAVIPCFAYENTPDNELLQNELQEIISIALTKSEFEYTKESITYDTEYETAIDVVTYKITTRVRYKCVVSNNAIFYDIIDSNSEYEDC